MASSTYWLQKKAGYNTSIKKTTKTFKKKRLSNERLATIV